MEPKYTYGDYAQRPEESGLELIDGFLVKHPSPTPYHQRLSRTIEFALWNFVSTRNLGEVLHAPLDVYLGEHETYQPDVIYIAGERLAIIGPKKIEGPPDLVLEILSPSTAYYDMKIKKRVYERGGVREYWIVDPEDHSIEVYELADGAFALRDHVTGEGIAASRILPGFVLDAARLFT